MEPNYDGTDGRKRAMPNAGMSVTKDEVGDGSEPSASRVEVLLCFGRMIGGCWSMLLRGTWSRARRRVSATLLSQGYSGEAGRLSCTYLCMLPKPLPMLAEETLKAIEDKVERTALSEIYKIRISEFGGGDFQICVNL